MSINATSILWSLFGLEGLHNTLSRRAQSARRLVCGPLSKAMRRFTRRGPEEASSDNLHPLVSESTTASEPTTASSSISLDRFSSYVAPRHAPVDDDGRRQLLNAVNDNDFAAVKRLVDIDDALLKTKRLSYKNLIGFPILTLAANNCLDPKFRHTPEERQIAREIVNFLLHHGANPNEDEHTVPLYYNQRPTESGVIARSMLLCIMHESPHSLNLLRS